MDKISNAITDFYITKNYISEEKKEIYSYGFQLILADIMNFAIIIFISLFLKRITDGIAFLITLCGIRQFSGGFHAKTFWQCRLYMVITFLCVMTGSQLLSVSFNILYVIIINSVCIVCIAALAPVAHPNKNITQNQHKISKVKAIIISLIIATFSCFLTAMERSEGVTISITLVAVVILMVAGIAAKKGGYYDA